jgi:hypothetical protein
MFILFESFVDGKQAEFEGLFQARPPADVVECGENNDVWIRVRRSTKSLELVSKQTGKIVTKCKVAEMLKGEFYGLTPIQVRLVQGVVAGG